MDVAPPPKRRQRVSRGRFRGKDLSFLIPPRIFHLGARVKSISEIEKYFYGTKRIMSEEERWKGDFDLFARLNSTQIMNSTLHSRWDVASDLISIFF